MPLDRHCHLLTSKDSHASLERMERGNAERQLLDGHQRPIDCFLRSFACYCRQDYPAKELVVAVHGAAQYARSITDCVEAAGRRDVRVLSCPAHLKLGELRNLALREASGPWSASGMTMTSIIRSA